LWEFNDHRFDSRARRLQKKNKKKKKKSDIYPALKARIDKLLQTCGSAILENNKWIQTNSGRMKNSEMKEEDIIEIAEKIKQIEKRNSRKVYPRRKRRNYQSSDRKQRRKGQCRG